MADDQTPDVAAALARMEAQLAALTAGQDARLIGCVRAVAKLYCLAAVEDALARVRRLEADLRAQHRQWRAELSDGPVGFRMLTSQTFQEALKERVA